MWQPTDLRVHGRGRSWPRGSDPADRAGRGGVRGVSSTFAIVGSPLGTLVAVCRTRLRDLVAGGCRYRSIGRVDLSYGTYIVRISRVDASCLSLARAARFGPIGARPEQRRRGHIDHRRRDWFLIRATRRSRRSRSRARVASPASGRRTGLTKSRSTSAGQRVDGPVQRALAKPPQQEVLGPRPVVGDERAGPAVARATSSVSQV